MLVQIIFATLITISSQGKSEITEIISHLLAKPITDISEKITQEAIFNAFDNVSLDLDGLRNNPAVNLGHVLYQLAGDSLGLPNLQELTVPTDYQKKFLQQFRNGNDTEDIDLHIKDLVRKYGYRIEEHAVQTSDGYILTLYRMPPALEDVGKSLPILLMHGLLGSSDDWIVTGPWHSLAYLLARQGYDVWLGNARGNTHSKRHASLSPDQPKFWDFTWHEIGIYDLPATVDYVLNFTETKQLKYVGFSQGTTTFFVMCSEKPQYNAKIAVAVALAPVAWMSHPVSPILKLAAANHKLFYDLFSKVGVSEFFIKNVQIRKIAEKACGSTSIADLMCSNVLLMLYGFSMDQINATAMPTIVGHTPAGASLKQFIHYIQSMVSGSFEKFDYGPKRNIRRYSSKRPPSYNVERITAPVALFYSDKDWLGNPQNVDKLRRKLPHVVYDYKVPKLDFNHLDFQWGVAVKSLVHETLLNVLKKF